MMYPPPPTSRSLISGRAAPGRLLRAVAALTAFLVLSVGAASAQSSVRFAAQPFTCGVSTAGLEIFFKVEDTSTWTITVRNETGATVHTSGPITAATNRLGSCDWIAETDNPNGSGLPGAANLGTTRLYTFEVSRSGGSCDHESALAGTGNGNCFFTYALPSETNNTSAHLDAYGFFMPKKGIGGNVDSDLFIVADGTGIKLIPSIYAYAGMSASATAQTMLPYDLLCTSNCPSGAGAFKAFISRQHAAPYTPLDFEWTFTSDGGNPLAVGPTQNWNWSGKNVRMPADRGIDVEGTFTATGLTMQPTSLSAGMEGFLVSGTLDLTDSMVDHAAGSGKRPGAVVVESGGLARLHPGTEIQYTSDGSGLVALGTQARIEVSGDVRILNNDHFGALAVSGGRLVFEPEGQLVPLIQYNDTGGVQVSGSGSRMDAAAVKVLNNDGPGVEALNGAFATISETTCPGCGGSGNLDGSTASLNPTVKSLVNDNWGGVSASGGAWLDTGIDVTCLQEPCAITSVGGHDILGNQGGASQYFDARSLAGGSKAGSTVIATANRWRLGSYTLASLVRIQDANSGMVLCPLVGGSCATQKNADGAGVAARGEGEGYDEDDLSGVLMPVLAASAAARGGDLQTAAALLDDALRGARHDGERGFVAATAARLLAETDGGAANELRRALQRSVQSGDATAPWATRAFATEAMSRGEAARAGALAATLTADPNHEVFALSVATEAAVALRDSAQALAAFTALHARDASASAALAVLVAQAFPGAGVDAAAAPARPEPAAARAAASPHRDVSLRVSPNPAADRPVVRIVLAEAVPAARLTLHDALGRDLRLLHDGALDAGETALALDTAGLPAGVYVVRLLADGAAASHTLSIVR